MASLKQWCVCLLSLTISHLLPSLAQSDNYIIHMDLLSMPKAFSSHHSWYMATIASVSDNTKSTITTTTTTVPSSSSKLIYGYTNAIHGFSANLSPSELEAIKNSPGYVSSTRDMPVNVDTTRTSQFLGLNSNYGAWPVSDYGKDVIIGFVDTGIWPESKSFGDHGMTEIPSRWKGVCENGTQFNSSMCNKKLIGARYFNKGLLTKYPNLTFPMNSARDIEGHGTHTSSTAAGNYVVGASYFGYASGTASGTAPMARVAMYKAIWEYGGYESDILAAIDQAIMDGVDILSLSLGADRVPMYEDPIAISAFAALQKGIFVSTSAGNRGPLPALLHNGTPWVLTVAAGTIDRDFEGIITLGNGVSIRGSALYPGNSIPSQVPMVFSEKCEDVGYRIVVCQDKNGSLGELYDNAKNAKVAGAIFISDYIDLDLLIQSSFPVVFLNFQRGGIILDYIEKSNRPKASLAFGKTRIGTKPAPAVASYSSRGPSKSCPFVLKPDLMAPGALVLASWPQNTPAAEVDAGKLFSNFNILSGTSMSCPHAAGVAALLKGAHPDWSPAAIRSAMMTTSDVLDNTFKPIQDIGDDNQPAIPLAMGAGHINPNEALDPGFIYDASSEDYVNLLCGLNFTMKQIQTITRSSSCSCSNPSLDLNYPSFIAYFNANDSNSNAITTQEFQRTVTYTGDGMSNYVAKLTPMDGLKVSVQPKKLVFREKNEKKSYKLSIKGPRLMKLFGVYGYLSWVEMGGTHVVRSPVVATRLRLETLA